MNRDARVLEGIFFCEGHNDDSLGFATQSSFVSARATRIARLLLRAAHRALGEADAAGAHCDVIASFRSGAAAFAATYAPGSSSRRLFLLSPDAETAAPYTRPARPHLSPPRGARRTSVVERERPGLLLEATSRRRRTRCSSAWRPRPRPRPRPAPRPSRLRRRRPADAPVVVDRPGIL